MALTQFAPLDIVSTKLDTANTQFNISTSAVAAISGIWLFVANSTTAGYLFKPDTSSLSSSNVASSAAFRHLANYFFGTDTYVIDAFDKTTQRTTVRAIMVGRPLLDEGIYPNSITAAFSGTNFALTAVDVVNVSSANSPLGLTGSFIDINTVASTAVSNTIGTVFYDHGVIVLHGGGSTTGNILCNASSGFTLGSTYQQTQLVCTDLVAQTRNVVKRTIYFCRAFNNQYNYTTNPTARTSDGRIVAGLTSNPTTWMTTVGLYDNDGNLLAVGKVNPPKRKDQYNESLFRVQLDF